MNTKTNDDPLGMIPDSEKLADLNRKVTLLLVAVAISGITLPVAKAAQWLDNDVQLHVGYKTFGEAVDDVTALLASAKDGFEREQRRARIKTLYAEIAALEALN